jgi:hypothetical protein
LKRIDVIGQRATGNGQVELLFATLAHHDKRRRKSSLTISAKQVGVGTAHQPLIPGGEPIWIVDAHRDDGKRFVVHADEVLTAFLELEAAIHARGGCS